MNPKRFFLTELCEIKLMIRQKWLHVNLILKKVPFQVTNIKINRYFKATAEKSLTPCADTALTGRLS